MNPNPVISSLVNFTLVLEEARSPRAAVWQSQFIDTCSQWCIYVETELAILPENQVLSYQQEAQQELEVTWHISLPPLPILLDALHHFYMTLLANVYLPQDLFVYLLSNYQFLNGGESARDMIILDFATTARRVATYNILTDMESLLTDNMERDD